MNKTYLSVAIALGLLMGDVAWGTQPQWQEFCPLEYVNAQLVPDIKPPGFLFRAASVFLLIPFPFLIHQNYKAIKARENNYWANRRINFESEVRDCGELADPSQCYRDIRHSQAQASQMKALTNEINGLRRDVRSLR